MGCNKAGRLECIFDIMNTLWSTNKFTVMVQAHNGVLGFEAYGTTTRLNKPRVRALGIPELRPFIFSETPQ